MSEKIKRNQWYPDHKLVPKKTSAELAADLEEFFKNGGTETRIESGMTAQQAEKKLSQEENRLLQKRTFKV